MPVDPDRPAEPEAPSPPRDALRALEDRLARASAAAERLVAEAARAASQVPPPQGWQTSDLRGADNDADGVPPDAGDPDHESDLELLVGVVHRLRGLIPADLQQRVVEALHELLLAVRALLDWYIERIERRRREPTPVRDIPIL